MTKILRTSTGNVLKVAGGGLINEDPVYPSVGAALEFTRLSNGLLDGINNRIVQSSANCRVYSVTINAVEYFVDWVNGYVDVSFTHNNCDYTMTVGEWGLCTLTYDPADAANLPANDTTAVIATISSYKLAWYKADIVSSPIGPLDIKVNGLSTGGGSDTVPPTVAGVSPTGFSVLLNQDTVLSCSENVQVGTGNFYKYNATTNALIETVAAASASYVGNTVTINWVVAEANSTSYSIRWDAGVFKDLAGNPVAAVTGNTWTYVTEAGSGGGINPNVDVTVSSLSALTAQLQDWETNWNTTTPAGKTNSDPRVVGINANTTGVMNLSGYVFPHRVYVRHVGSFTATAAGVTSCSVFHSGTGTMNNSTNLWMYLLDLRAPDNAAYNNGLWQISGTNNCGVVRCTIKGWPFTIDTTASGATALGLSTSGTNTNFTFKHNTGYYFGDGILRYGGTLTNLVNEGNMGNYYGGDDYTMMNGVVIVDPIWRCNFYARRRMVTPGLHNDGIQFNKNNGSNTPATRWFSEYDVFLRGKWGGGALSGPSESGWGAYFTSDSKNTSVGPHLHQHCLFINGHVRSVTGFPGGGLTANYCTAVQHNNDQPPTAGWPAIRGVASATGNFCTGQTNSFNTVIGTNGKLLAMGGASNGTGANFNLLLPYFTTIPTNYTDLWAIRPPVGAETHPNYSGNKIGCWRLWEKLFNGDSDIVLSKVGWPVAPLFIADFDTGDNFWGSYTGTFDANGDNA